MTNKTVTLVNGSCDKKAYEYAVHESARKNRINRRDLRIETLQDLNWRV